MLKTKRDREAGAIAAALAMLGAFLGAAVARAQAFEPLPVLKASDFLEPRYLEGPDHKVEMKVFNDDLFNIYTITSTFGAFEARGTSLARVRIHEVGAIAELKQVNRAAVAAGAARDSLVGMGKGAVNVVTNPVETAQGIGDGVSRLFGRVGRSVRRTGERLDGAEAGTEAQAQRSTGEQVADTSGQLAQEVLGVNRAMRRWAQRVEVDPYTHNELLRAELRAVANYDAAGRFATKLFPLGVAGSVLGATSTVNNLVWEMDADELITLNENRLTAMGTTPEVSRAFRLNRRYTLAGQTHLVASLDALEGVPGRPEFVALASTASDESAAIFYQESAFLAESFHRDEAPLTGIVSDLPGACVTAEGRFVCLFPVDYIVWTESVAGMVAAITRRAETDFPSARREIWLTGRTSARTGRELEARGWKVSRRGRNAEAVADGPASK